MTAGTYRGLGRSKEGEGGDDVKDDPKAGMAALLCETVEPLAVPTMSAHTLGDPLASTMRPAEVSGASKGVGERDM
jgi:hypothetical protein